MQIGERLALSSGTNLFISTQILVRDGLFERLSLLAGPKRKI